MSKKNIAIPAKHGNLSVPIPPETGATGDFLTKSSASAYDMQWGKTVGDGTNTTTFGSDGRQTMTGDARVKKEIRIEAINTKKGAAAPAVAERAVGASGAVIMPVLTFSKVTQQDCYFILHTPSDLDASEPLHFHLMWQPGAAWTGGTYIWKLEYLVMNESGATLLAGTPDTITSGALTPANATTNIETEYADNIVMIADQLLIGHFYRDVADTADDIGCVTFFEFEYVANSLGEAI